MARWKLTAAHYLQVEGSEWEYKEQSSAGKMVRQIYPVPQLLDPKTATDWNDVQLGPMGQAIDGAVIVAYAGHGAQPRDYIFTGPPTPDMEPLDDEAQAISERESKKWIHPIESLSGDYSQSLLNDLTRQLAELQAGQIAKAEPQSLGSVSQEEFNELKEMMKQVMEQNAALQAQLLEKPAARRV